MRYIFAIGMLLFCGLLAWTAVDIHHLQAQTQELRTSLETSQGRERKQQYEYDAVASEIPLLQAELAVVQPQAEAAATQEAELRARRKELRAIVKAQATETPSAAEPESTPAPTEVPQ